MKFPQQGRSRDDILSSLEAFKGNDVPWQEGRVFAYIYDAGEDAKQLLRDAFGLYLTENGLDQHLRERGYQAVGSMGLRAGTCRVRLKTSRRMRGGELHYLDHARFGVLVLVSQVGG